MFRHSALRPLSRRHQAFLFHARELKWRAAAILDGRHDHFRSAVPEFLAFHEEYAESHYRAEAQILIPLIRRYAADGHEAIDRTLAAQAAICAAVDEVTTNDRASPDQITHMAALVHTHTRDQERTLFPYAEQVLGEAGLAELEEQLDAYVI